MTPDFTDQSLWSADAVKRFLREARVAARLNHPTVVAVHDVDQLGGQCFLVMELVKGSTAAELLAQGTLIWGEATRLSATVTVTVGLS